MKIRLVKLLLGLGTAAMLLSGCYKKEIADLHNTHDADMANLRNGLASVEGSVQTTVNNLEAAKTTLEAEISNLQQQIKDASGKTEEFAGEIKTLKEKLTECENKLVKVNEFLAKIDIDEIDSKFEELNVLIETAGKMEGRVSSLEENQAFILKSYATLAKVEEIVNGAFAEFVANDFYTNLEKYKATILAWFTQDLSEQMKAALDTAFNNYYTIAQVDEQLDNMRDEIYDEMDDVCGDMGKDIEDLKDSIEVHRTEIDALKKSVSALEGDVVDIIKEAIEKGEFEEAFGKLLSDLTSDVSQLKTDVGTLKTDVEKIFNIIGGDDASVLTTTSKTLFGAINELKARIDTVVDPTGKFAKDIAAVKAEADSLANVTKALESKYGSASGRIDSLASVTASIEANYTVLFNRVDSLKDALNTRIKDLEAIKGISLVFIPEYSDGNATIYVDPDNDDVASLTMNFKVFSERTLKDEWFAQDEIRGIFKQTRTRASVAGEGVEPNDVEFANNILTVTFDYDDFSEIFEVNGSASVAITVGGVASSEYIPIYVEKTLGVDPEPGTFFFSRNGGESETINVTAAPGVSWSISIDGDNFDVNLDEDRMYTGDREVTITTRRSNSDTEGVLKIYSSDVEYTYVIRQQRYLFSLNYYSGDRSISVYGASIYSTGTSKKSAKFTIKDASGQTITSGVTESDNADWFHASFDEDGFLTITFDEWRGGSSRWSNARTATLTISYGGQSQSFSVTQTRNRWWWDD